MSKNQNWREDLHDHVIQRIKEKYTQGTRIMCDCMYDPFHPVPIGTLGTVKFVDDIGTIHVAWDNGQNLGLVLGEDCYHKITERTV